MDKSPAPYARLQEEVSQDQSNSSNPFVSYTHQQPYTGAEAVAVKPAQEIQYAQPQAQQTQQIQPPQTGQGQITMMVGNSPQQVLIPPGFALVPGPNGQLMLQQIAAAPYATVPYAMAPVPMQPIKQYNVNDLDDGWFVALKVWLIILMVALCGGTLMFIVMAITTNWPVQAVFGLPQMFIFYCLFVEYQALTQKNLSKAKLAFMLLTILQGLMLISYIVIVTAVVDPDVTGVVSAGFWSYMSIFDITVYWGAYQVRKILQGSPRVHQAIVMA